MNTMKPGASILFPLMLAVPCAVNGASADFVRDVRPLFEKHCSECHGEKKQKSGLRLDVKAAAMKGGDEQGPAGNLARPQYEFRPRGQTGKWVSDMIPHLAALTDDIAFVHSLTSKSNTHGPAENFLSTGFTLDGFPSVGSWVSYALGSENQDLPAFVAIPDPRGVPQAGSNNWGPGFLPAVFQGTPMSAREPVRHLAPPRAK